MAKTKFLILPFLYCGEIVKNSTNLDMLSPLNTHTHTHTHTHIHTRERLTQQHLQKFSSTRVLGNEQVYFSLLLLRSIN